MKTARSITTVLLVIVLISVALAATSFTPAEAAGGASGWKFRADAANTGVYDDGGVRPSNVQKWSYTTGGIVYSSPAISNGMVYVGSYDGNVYALNAADGTKVWSYVTGGTASSPAVANGLVYIGGTDGYIYALNAADGTKLWSYWIGYGNAGFSSPAVDNGVVYVGSFDNNVYALGKAANAAPSITAVTVPIDPQRVNDPVSVSAAFTDPDQADTHTATWTWGDGTTSAGTIIESNGAGTVSGSHVYAEAGVYTVSVKVTDNYAASAEVTAQSYVVVYNPDAGFVTGGGWITSPTGAYAKDPALTGKATFGFVSKYQKGANAPTGNTEFQFKVANLNFKSTSYDWLVIAGAKAQYKGTGTINGAGSYKFMLSAVDGNLKGTGPDTFRMKIWDDNGVVYDNAAGAPDTAAPTTTLGGGSIVIHP